MGASVDYLLKDAKTGRLSFRRAYPAELRAFIPGNPSQLKRSLGTSRVDAPGAIDKFTSAAAEYDRQVSLARKAASQIFDPLDAPTIAYLAEAFRAESLARDMEARWGCEERDLYAETTGQLDDCDVFEGHERRRWVIKARETVEASAAHSRTLLGSGDMVGILEVWAGEAKEFALARGYRISPDDESFRHYCIAIAEAALSAAEDRLARLDGELVLTPEEPKAPLAKAISRLPAAAAEDEGLDSGGLASDPTFIGILEDIRDNPRLTRPSTKERLETALRYWREVYGDKLRPQDVTRRRVSDWIDMLAQRPSRIPRNEQQLPMPELLKRYGKRSDVPKLSGATQESLVLSLSGAWNKASQRGDMPEGLQNPFQRHSVTVEARPETPQELSLPELQAIFALPIFTQGERPRRGKGEASFFIPLLLLWTGARPEEVAQLLVSDIIKDADSGRWMIRYTGEGVHPHKGRRSLKTERFNSGQRTIPIPKPLVNLGFLAYVEWLRESGETAMFPKLRVKKARGDLFPSYGEWWSAFLRERQILQAGRRPSRELRHNFATACRRVGVHADAERYIMGHSTEGDVHMRYGSRQSLGAEVDKISYPGLDLSGVKHWRRP